MAHVQSTVAQTSVSEPRPVAPTRAAIPIHGTRLNSQAESSKGIKKRKRELRVTIDEADNFGLVLVRSSQSTLTEASSAPTPNNPR